MAERRTRIGSLFSRGVRFFLVNGAPHTHRQPPQAFVPISVLSRFCWGNGDVLRYAPLPPFHSLAEAPVFAFRHFTPFFRLFRCRGYFSYAAPKRDAWPVGSGVFALSAKTPQNIHANAQKAGDESAGSGGGYYFGKRAMEAQAWKPLFPTLGFAKGFACFSDFCPHALYEYRFISPPFLFNLAFSIKFFQKGKENFSAVDPRHSLASAAPPIL